MNKSIVFTLETILKNYVFSVFLLTTITFTAQNEKIIECNSNPPENSHLLEPFYGNSKALLNVLKDANYNIPKDYLENLSIDGSYTGMSQNRAASTPIIREIPVKAWIYRNNNGSGNITMSSLNNIINNLNNLFASNTNIRFYLLCNVSFINNSNYANYGDTYFDDYTLNNRVTGALNVHFVISSNGEWGGRANFPFYSGDPRRFSCAISQTEASSLSNTTAHEVGHTLGLYHTHHYGRATNHSNNGGCGDCHQESVSRTRRQEFGCIDTYNELKCDVNGDFLCDTAADPQLSSALVNYGSCNYTSTYTDNWGEVWTPNVNNIMSYSYHTCRDYFSPLQVGKMNYYYGQIGISYPFYSINGPNYICSGQTSYYSVTSSPGVSYTWETSSNLSITSGQGTNSISVQASNNNGGFVKVTPSCGNKSVTKNISVFTNLEIDGYDTACAQNGYSYNYSIPNLSGANYFWSITNGTINYGQGTNLINVTLSSHPSNQSNISLQINNVCSNTIYKYKTILHGNPPPPAEQCFGFMPQNTNENSVLTENAIILSPNPANNILNVSLQMDINYDLQIIDIYGTIKHEKPNSNDKNFSLDLKYFSTGMYFLRFNTKGGLVFKKLIISK